MKLQRAAIFLVSVTFFYVGILLYLDSKNNLFSEMSSFVTFLPFLLAASFFSFFVRYLRWYFLLKSVGQQFDFGSGFFCYLSGFAFTASPGKVGELLRVRYFSRMGVAPDKVISAFVYERFLDLVVVSMLSIFAAFSFSFFPVVLSFITFVIVVVLVLGKYPKLLRLIAIFLRNIRLRRAAFYFMVLARGVSGIYLWINLKDFLISFVLGLLAWLLISLSFWWLLKGLNVDIPSLAAISIYPIAMLVGAASMLPGGVGSTEAAIIIQLTHYSVPIAVAGTIAICIRIATLWFAMLCGMLSMLFLEGVTPNGEAMQ